MPSFSLENDFLSSQLQPEPSLRIILHTLATQVKQICLQTLILLAFLIPVNYSFSTISTVFSKPVFLSILYLV